MRRVDARWPSPPPGGSAKAMEPSFRLTPLNTVASRVASVSCVLYAGPVDDCRFMSATSSLPRASSSTVGARPLSSAHLNKRLNYPSTLQQNLGDSHSGSFLLRLLRRTRETYLLNRFILPGVKIIRFVTSISLT